MPRKRLHITLLLTLLMQLPDKALFSQEIYRSREGSLSATTTYFSHLITVHSKNVGVSLDYETSAVVLTLLSGDLHTGIDSLDGKLKEQATMFVLRGNLNLGRINTTTHLPQSFQLNGALEIGQNRKVEIKGVGRLEHIGGGENLACELGFYFDVDARTIGLHQLVESPEDKHLVKIQFFDTVLRKAN